MYINTPEMHLKRLLSYLNKEPTSPSVGSFDRNFWAWKKRDFQDSTLAFSGVPLLKLLAKLNYPIAFKKEIENFLLRNLLSIQKRNGSFDQTYPNELHPKVGLDICDLLILLNGDIAGSPAFNIYKKVILYSFSSEETYGTISNHMAHHMFEYLRAAEILEDDQSRAKAHQLLYNLNNQISKEGWFVEYDGADPGYQTRTLKYLVRSTSYLDGRDRSICLNLCDRSMEFLDKTILPDGTLFSAFGSRNTSLIYPSGIELMAKKDNEWDSLANRVRKAVKNAKAPPTLSLDFDNYIRLLDDHIEADRIYDSKSANINTELKNPKRSKQFYLKDYGLLKRRLGEYDLYIHSRYGGAFILFKGDSCIEKNAGLYLALENGKKFATFKSEANSSINSKSTVIELNVEYALPINENLTSMKLIFLRILNFSILRVRFFANLFRKLLVNRFISSLKPNDGVQAVRFFSLHNNVLKITDKIETKTPLEEAYLVPQINLRYMASSGYWEGNYHSIYEDLSHNIHRNILRNTKEFDLR